MSDFQFLCIPPARFGEVWPAAGGLLLRGLLTASNIGVLECIDGCRSGSYQCWLIREPGKSHPVGAFITSIFFEDGRHKGRKLLGVYALAGQGISRWASALRTRMLAFARAEECVAVQFSGRSAYRRIYPDCEVVGEIAPGVSLFERAA